MKYKATPIATVLAETAPLKCRYSFELSPITIMLNKVSDSNFPAVSRPPPQFRAVS